MAECNCPCTAYLSVSYTHLDVYKRQVVMEPFVMSGGTVGSEIKVWRDLVPDAKEEMLDNDAKGAVEFLRHVFEN